MNGTLLILTGILCLTSCARTDGIFWTPDETQNRISAMQQLHTRQQQQERTLETRQQKLKQTQTKTRQTY